MQGRIIAKQLGRLGIWSNTFERLPNAEAGDLARRIENLGFGALWFPESVGSKEVFAQSALLLTASTRIVVAPGIANIFARDAHAMANGARTLAEAFPGRFVLGLGVSHLPSVATRGGEYRRPLETMARYLDAMDAAPTTLRGAADAPRLLAALGPKMLALAARRSDGAHPYFSPLEHTGAARATVGSEPCLAVEVACVLERDATIARKIARTYTKRYLSLENYTSNLRRIGWPDADLAGEGSDRLVDALVAWGEPSRIAEHLAAHRAAGADHLAVQVLTAAWPAPPLEELRILATALR